MIPAKLKSAALRVRGSGWAGGYLNPALLPTAERIETLNAAGQPLQIEPGDLMAVLLLADIRQADLMGSAGAARGTRMPGLRVKVRTLDHYGLEGILATNLLELDRGLWLDPLYSGSIWQRAFFPRSAVEQLQAVEMTKAPRRRPNGRSVQQFGLFETSQEEEGT
ncbi:MAG: DUF6982 domain-containing protein [Terriglobales bacterium]